MSRLSYCAALAILTAVIASSAANARTKHNSADSFAGAHNGPSEMDIRKECYEVARLRWPSLNQEMQTNRDFAYRACAFDRGVRNP
jgi:hypothetical protein